MSDTLSDSQPPSDTQAIAKLDELRAASVNFLVDVKTRFGENSPRLHNVHEALDTFKRGERSKRDAHRIILNTLEGHEDLRQQLMDIIMHPAADWARDDFDLPTEQPMQPLMGPAPQFLQPAHQPQMRLPSISSSWFTAPPVDQSSGQISFGGYNSMVSSPLLPGLAPLQLPHPSTHFWKDHNAKTVYPAVNEEANLPSLVYTAFRNPWQDESYADIWTNDGVSSSLDGTHVDEYLGPASGTSYSGHLQLPMGYFQNSEVYQKTSSSLPNALPPIPAPRMAYGPPPDSTDDKAFLESSFQEDHHTNIPPPPTPNPQSPPDLQQTQDAEVSGRDKPVDRHQSLGELYIHALCGKGFATLPGVKKHHWGKKANDLSTTTGCWAKHKKPDVAWDAHPSCKDERSAFESAKFVSFTSKQGQPKASISQLKALQAWNLPQFNTIPGFPTLDDLPNTVAKTVGTGNACVSGPEEWESSHHTHRLPSWSSFDSLLTAVNMVSQIDAPNLEAPTDSIALHLDAQVAAEEQHAPFLPPANTFDPQRARSIVPTALKTKYSSMGELPDNTSGRLRSHDNEVQRTTFRTNVEE